MAFLDLNGLQYFYSKIIAKVKTLIPAKTSQLTNDSNYLAASGTAAKATADANGNNIANTYMKKYADCDLDMNDYAITINMGWIQFTDSDAPVSIYNNTDDKNDAMFVVYDDNAGEDILNVSRNGGTIGGSKILTEANSTAVIVTADATTTPDVNSYGLWAY